MRVCQNPGRELTTSLPAGQRRWTIFFTLEISGCFLTFLYFLPENSSLWHGPTVHAGLAFLPCVLCLKCNHYFRSCVAPYKSLCRHIRNANASPLLGHTQDQSVSSTAMAALDLTTHLGCCTETTGMMDEQHGLCLTYSFTHFISVPGHRGGESMLVRLLGWKPPEEKLATSRFHSVLSPALSVGSSSRHLHSHSSEDPTWGDWAVETGSL